MSTVFDGLGGGSGTGLTPTQAANISKLPTFTADVGDTIIPFDDPGPGIKAVIASDDGLTYVRKVPGNVVLTGTTGDQLLLDGLVVDEGGGGVSDLTYFHRTDTANGNITGAQVTAAGGIYAIKQDGTPITTTVDADVPDGTQIRIATDNGGNFIVATGRTIGTDPNVEFLSGGEAVIEVGTPDCTVVFFNGSDSIDAYTRAETDNLISVHTVTYHTDVIRFGADPSGVSDSTLAIQNGIDYLAGIGGGKLLFPKGTYLCDGVEVLNDNIVLEGDGIGATKILYTNVTGTAAAVSFGQSKTGTGAMTAVADCAIRKMEIDCQSTTAGGIVGAGVRSTVFNGFIVEEVFVHDCYNNYGFAIVGTGFAPRDGLVIKNCVSRRCGRDGLDIKASAHRIIIDGFYTEGHVDHGAGDSVGLDVRGQYVSVQNVFAENCPEVGIRVRANAGIQQPADTDWTLTQDAKISVTNCFAYGCRDGFRVTAPLNSSVSVANCHSFNNTRYGVLADGPGRLHFSNSSFNLGVRGLSLDSESHVDFVNCEFSFNTSDGIVLTAAGNGTQTFTNCHADDNARYGYSSVTTSAATHVKFIGGSINRNLTGINASAATLGLYEFIHTEVDDNTSRGLQLSGSSAATFRFERGSVQNNALDVQSTTPTTSFDNVLGVNSKFTGSTTVAVDTTGNKSFSFTHGLYTTPDMDKIQLSLARDGAVEDFTTDWLMVTGASGTIISAKLKVATASATGGALVKVNCRVEV